MYKAVLDDSQTVAVKFMNPSDVGSHASNRERFEAEIQIMQLCQHENVVACLGAWIQPVRLLASYSYSISMQHWRMNLTTLSQVHHSMHMALCG